MVRIDSYSQYFTVTSSNYSKLIHTLYDFNKSLITYRMALTRVKGQSKPKVITKPDKYFYVAETRDIGYAVKKDVIRYPITLLESLVTFLEDRGVDKDTIEIEHHDHMKGRSVDIDLNPKFKPRDYQEVYISKIAELDKHNILIDLITGGGKATSCNTPIKIKHGWKRIGDVRKGEKVIGRDGLETTVTGVYPQGMRQLYKVTFSDGRSVDVDIEHLWSIYTAETSEVSVVENTEKIISRLSNNDEVFIDLVDPIDITDELQRYDKDVYKHITFNSSGELFLTVELDTLDEALLICRSLGHQVFVKEQLNSSTVIILVRSKDSCNGKLQIVSIEKSIKADAVCISVDNKDKLYVVKDFIVTHNTFISMASMARINKAFSMIVLPRYIEKWIGDITELTNIQEHEICVIKGLTNLTTLLNDPVTAKNYKCFIISLTTLNYFIKKYNTGELLEYTTKGPEDLFKSLGTEIVLNDETHQEFHNVYRNMLYANIKMFIGITATLVSKDPDTTRMHDIMFPEENRISNIVKMEPYIYITSVRFRFMYKKQIRFKNHFGYNQAIFENSIMKNSVILHNYLKMIYGLLRGFYDKKRTDGDKCIIFMGTINMCNLTVDYIRSKSSLKVTKYTEEDDYSVIEESDIIVATPGSASTALDIPNLITTIQTVNVDSTAANLQTLGRLRNIKDKRMDFVYIWTSDIRQHKSYNYNRLKLFVKRAKHIRSIEYRELV